MNNRPRSGLYQGDELQQAWQDLKRRIDEFYPNHIVSGQIGGTKSAMAAKAKALELQAKILVEICKGICK